MKKGHQKQMSFSDMKTRMIGSRDNFQAKPSDIGYPVVRLTSFDTEIIAGEYGQIVTAP